jgi:hypothetical protein
MRKLLSKLDEEVSTPTPSSSTIKKESDQESKKLKVIKNILNFFLRTSSLNIKKMFQKKCLRIF